MTKIADTTAVNDEEKIAVRNLVDHQVGYTTQSGIRRTFAPGMTLKVSAGELRELNYTPGGNILLTDYLHIDNPELAAEFGVSEDSFEHEYSWTRADMERVLLEDDLDVLLDALEFAPDGIKDTLVNMATELEIPSVPKREAIKNATGIDINVRINNKHLINQDKKVEEKKPAKRRATTSKKNTGRRATKKIAAKADTAE